MNKKYKCGLYVGRFQPLHWGHASIIFKMVEECEKIIVAIGSATEYGTKRNPFSYALRDVMVRELLFSRSGPLPENVYIVPVEDREHPSNDPSWGNYLVDRVRVYTGTVPDMIYEGEESERVSWYDNVGIPVTRVSRTAIKTSGTQVRECLLANDRVSFNILTPFTTNVLYDELRKEILKCLNSQNM